MFLSMKGPGRTLLPQVLRKASSFLRTLEERTGSNLGSAGSEFGDRTGRTLVRQVQIKVGSEKRQGRTLVRSSEKGPC